MRNVLIETLWNVKLDISFEVFFQVVRINRNIVECKGPRSTRNGSHVFVLIETLWNVKSHFTRDDSVLSLY